MRAPRFVLGDDTVATPVSPRLPRRTAARASIAVLAAVVGASALSACAPRTAQDTTNTPSTSSSPTSTQADGNLGIDDGGVPSVDAAPPLPADAQVLSLDDLPPQPNDSCELFQTLAPNEADPKENVPRIVERGRLVVGLDQGSNLFSFRDPVSGQLEGFDVDLAREIARDIFDDPERVEFRSLTSEERVQALQDGRVDVVVKSMSITCERRATVRFSAPYYSANQRLLTVRGSGLQELEDLDGKRVCVARGTTSAARLREIVTSLTVLTVNTWADCLVAIQQGQVDAITTDDAILAGVAAQDPNLEIVGRYVAAEPYGVGIPKSTPELNTDGLVRQVNATLERIQADGTWRTMFSRWLGPYTSNSQMPAPVYVNEEAEVAPAAGGQP